MIDDSGTPEDGQSSDAEGRSWQHAEPTPSPDSVVDFMSNDPAPAAKPKRTGWLIAAAVAAVLVIVGSITVVLVMNHRADVAAAERREAAERKQAAEEKAEEEARQAEEEAAAAELAAAEAQYDSCADQLNPLFNALQKVDARLDVGLSQSDLSTMVGDASVAYSRIDIDELGTGTCLTTGARLESAFNAYAGTVSKWNDCIYDYGCDTDAITPSLQAKWSDASRAIDKASRLLDSLDPNSSSYDASTASEIL